MKCSKFRPWASPIRGLTRSPVRGIFSSQRLHDFKGCKMLCGHETCRSSVIREQPELGPAKHRLVADRELSHADIRSSL